MKIKKESFFLLTFQILMISLYFGAFNIDIGFAIKPYMVVTAIIAILFVNNISIRGLFTYEWVMLLFILAHSMTALKFSFPEKHLRFILAFIVVLFFYFVMRGLVDKIAIDKFELMLSRAGLIGISVSFIYYSMGILETGMDYYGNAVIYHGLLLDRSMPRLIGTVSTDPNIFVFFISIYFMYTLFNHDTKSKKLGLLLSGISIILSFSRGAYVSIMAALVISFIIEPSKKDKFKSLFFLMGAIGLIILAGNYLSIDIIDIASNRFTGISTDGGSGRNVLWTNAISTFKQYPIFGIGINATTSYGSIHYNDGHYVHNTLLEVLSESGLFGFSIYALLWFLLFRHSIRLYRRNKKTKFILITFIAMFFQMIFLSILYSEIFYFAMIVLFRYSIESSKPDI